MIAQKTQQTRRIQWIDLVKCIAILTVLLIHTIDNTLLRDVDSLVALTSAEQMVVAVVSTIGRVGVPMFFMASGSLLLDRRFDKEYTAVFYKNNFLPLLLTTELWIVGYYFFVAWYYQIDVSSMLLVKNFFLLDTVYITHIWYMYVILGIYLFIPFLANALQHTDGRWMMLPLGISMAYLSLIPTINIIRQTMGLTMLDHLISLDFSGGIYGILLIMGYYYKKGCFSKIPTVVVFIASICSFIATVGIQMFSFRHGYDYQLWYDCLPLIIFVLSLYELISRIPLRGNHKGIQSLAKCSFGIYLIHNPVLMVMGRDLWEPSLIKKIILMYVLVLLGSWLLVVLIGKIPVVRKIIFNMK